MYFRHVDSSVSNIFKDTVGFFVKAHNAGAREQIGRDWKLKLKLNKHHKRVQFLLSLFVTNTEYSGVQAFVCPKDSQLNTDGKLS